MSVRACVRACVRKSERVAECVSKRERARECVSVSVSMLEIPAAATAADAVLFVSYLLGRFHNSCRRRSSSRMCCTRTRARARATLSLMWFWCW